MSLLLIGFSILAIATLHWRFFSSARAAILERLIDCDVMRSIGELAKPAGTFRKHVANATSSK